MEKMDKKELNMKQALVIASIAYTSIAVCVSGYFLVPKFFSGEIVKNIYSIGGIVCGILVILIIGRVKISISTQIKQLPPDYESKKGIGFHLKGALLGVLLSPLVYILVKTVKVIMNAK